MKFREPEHRPPVQTDLLTLGEVMGLLLAQPGVPLAAARQFELGIAGAEAGVAVGLARLGRSAALVSRLGDDALGRHVGRALLGEGVDTSAVRVVPDRPTGLLLRDAPGDRAVSVAYYRDGSAGSTLSAHDVPEDRLAAARVLHVTGITAMISHSAREAVRHAVRIARRHGVLVTFDPNVRLRLGELARWREVVTELASVADVVLTGADDARVVTDGPAADWFLERGARIVVTKDGASGAQETDGEVTVRQPVRPTREVDPVGAGDAFAAGWIDGWLAGLDASARMERAAAVASLCVGAAGDLAGLPDARTLDTELARTTDVAR